MSRLRWSLAATSGSGPPLLPPRTRTCDNACRADNGDVRHFSRASSEKLVSLGKAEKYKNDTDNEKTTADQRSPHDEATSDTTTQAPTTTRVFFLNKYIC